MLDPEEHELLLHALARLVRVGCVILFVIGLLLMPGAVSSEDMSLLEDIASLSNKNDT